MALWRWFCCGVFFSFLLMTMLLIEYLFKYNFVIGPLL